VIHTSARCLVRLRGTRATANGSRTAARSCSKTTTGLAGTAMLRAAVNSGLSTPAAKPPAD